MKLLTLLALTLSLVCGPADSALAQAKDKAVEQKPKPKQPKKPKPRVRDFRKKAIPFREFPVKLAEALKKIAKEGIQVDLPAAAVDQQGRGLVAYLEWNGKSDALRLARTKDEGFAPWIESIIARIY